MIVPKDAFEIAEYGILAASNSKNSLSKAMKWAIEHQQELSKYKEKGIIKSREFEISNVCNEFSVIFDANLKKTSA